MRMCSRPQRVATNDISWFDREDRYSGGKWYGKWRRAKLVDKITTLAPHAYDALNIQFAAIEIINPVEKSRRPRPVPFKHRGELTMYHFLAKDAIKVIVVSAGGERYGLAWDGSLYLCRRIRLLGSVSKVDLWIPLPKKLGRSCLTSPMLQALLEAFEAIVPVTK